MRNKPALAGRNRPGFALSQLVAVVAVIATGAFALLVKEPTAAVAGAVLVAIVAIVGGALLFGGDEAPESAPQKDDGALAGLAKTLESNRAEYTAKIADLKRSLDAQKSAAAASDNEVLREELGKIRAELVSLRSMAARR